MTTAPLTSTRSRQPWLCSPSWDTSLIIAPALVSSALAIMCRTLWPDGHDLPLWAWVAFVLLIDVAHVYATLFRTYFEPAAREQHGTLLIAIPVACWVVGSLFYSIDALVFWRALAYLAVFHFIRQQYGFVMLYARHEIPEAAQFKWLDAACIYGATLYPLLYWHTHLPRNFSWFVEGDFFSLSFLDLDLLQQGAAVLFGGIAIAYFAKEFFFTLTTGSVNVPKNLIILGTAVSWWVGIVLFNSDMAFTVTNVVTHGIPYMALVWLYQGRISSTESGDDSAAPRSSLSHAVSRFSRAALKSAPLFIVFLWALAYLEEGMWDGLVWREHLNFFQIFAVLPSITDASVLAILIPFLALPQSMHYVLDGFIWRIPRQHQDSQNTWAA